MFISLQVNVMFTQYGRAIKASEDMEPGDTCFRDKAAVLAQTLDTLNVAACRLYYTNTCVCFTTIVITFYFN